MSDSVSRTIKCFVEFRECKSYYNSFYGRWQDRVVVEHKDDRVIARYFLHDHEIARLTKYRGKDELELVLWHCGYPTQTTFSRLRNIALKLDDIFAVDKHLYHFIINLEVSEYNPIICIYTHKYLQYRPVFNECYLFDKPIKILLGNSPNIKVVGDLTRVVHKGSEKFIVCFRYKRRKVCIDKDGNAYTKLTRTYMTLNRELTEEFKDKMVPILLSYK